METYRRRCRCNYSDTDAEKETKSSISEILFQLQGERHRLVGLDNWGLLLKWRHLIRITRAMKMILFASRMTLAGDSVFTKKTGGTGYHHRLITNQNLLSSQHQYSLTSTSGDILLDTRLSV